MAKRKPKQNSGEGDTWYRLPSGEAVWKRPRKPVVYRGKDLPPGSFTRRALEDGKKDKNPPKKKSGISAKVPVKSPSGVWTILGK